MKLLADDPVLFEPLHKLDRRVRWIRWFRGVNRAVWIVVCLFLATFLADALIGLRVLPLRVALVALLVSAFVSIVAVSLFVWHLQFDPVGLAYLFEKSHPEFGERLVTLTQVSTDLTPNEEAIGRLEREARDRLASIAAHEVFPPGLEWRRALELFVVPFMLMIGLFIIFPPLSRFSGRLLTSWSTPLVPFAIDVVRGDGYAVRGDSYLVEASCRLIDANATAPEELLLVAEPGNGDRQSILMKKMLRGHYAATLKDLQTTSHCRIVCEAEDIVSDGFDVHPVEPPAFTSKPTVVVSPPRYVADAARTMTLDDATADEQSILQFSRMEFRFALKPEPLRMTLAITRSSNESSSERLVAGSSQVAAATGSFSAELRFELDHGLTSKLPLGRWTVHEDREPRFTQPARLQGQGSATAPDKPATISVDDLLRVQAHLEDDEGLADIDIEYRVNDEPAQTRRWLHAHGKKHLAIDDWLPLPKTLKQGDVYRFRVRASDNRLVRKGELGAEALGPVPPHDLLPHVVISPSPVGREDRWIELRVDRSTEGFVAEQIRAQGDKTRQAIEQIKQKLDAEAAQLQKLQRSLHEQAVLTPDQVRQAAKIRAVNQEVVDGLIQAGAALAKTPELANLAGHLFDLAGGEMQESALALERFENKDQPPAERKKQVPIAQDAVRKAQQKLARFDEWNKLVAEDRLDQWKLQKLAQRENELASRLEKLNANTPLTGDELAREIEQIRQEQARLAEQIAEMRKQSRLVQEALESLQIHKLAQTAKELTEKAKTPAKEPGQPLMEKTAKLAADLAELSQKGIGPEAKAMGKEAAQAADLAKKSMEAGQAAQAKGDKEQAKAMSDEAAKQLDLVTKRLDALQQDQAMKPPANDEAIKMEQALRDSEKAMRVAEKSLPEAPRQAQAAMQQAARQLQEAAERARKQSARNVPLPSRHPADQARPGLGGAAPSKLPPELRWSAATAKSWGELPGEMKTRLLQDFRARFGDEYAELIQQYFERLAETTPRK